MNLVELFNLIVAKVTKNGTDDKIHAVEVRETLNEIVQYGEDRAIAIEEVVATKADLVGGKVDPLQLPEVVNTNKRLLSGGISYAGTGMNWDYSQLIYEWASTPQIVPASTVPITLNDGDDDFDRIDAVCINSDGEVVVIEGEPSENPATPNISDYILVQYVIVTAGETEPTITTQVIYADNAGETVTAVWNGSGASGNIDFNHTTAAQQGTKCIKFTTVSAGRRARFTFTAPVNLTDFQFLSFYIKLDSALPNAATSLPIVMRNAIDANVGTYQNAMSFGINRTIIGQWQLVLIPTSLFATAADIASVIIGFANGAALNYSIDNIRLVSGIVQPPTNNGTTVIIQSNGTVVGEFAKLNFNNDFTVTNDTVNGRAVVVLNWANGDSFFIPRTGGVLSGDVVELSHAAGCNKYLKFWDDGYFEIGSISDEDNMAKIFVGPGEVTHIVKSGGYTLTYQSTVGGIGLGSDEPSFAGLYYNADYSANFSARSLVDKGYVDLQVPYKVYEALLTQSGTGAPTATVLRNTLGGVPVWTRINFGSYVATLVGAFGLAKTAVIPTAVSDSGVPGFAGYEGGKYSVSNDDCINIFTSNDDGTSTNDFKDNLLFNSFIEIRVYP